MNASGQCLCGAVAYTASDVSQELHACHCNTCRRWTGGPAFAVGVGAIQFKGEEHITRFASSDWAERGFCSQCGSNLFYWLKEANHYVLWLGTFEDPHAFTLSGEIFVDEKPAGYSLAGEHPRMTGDEFFASLNNPEE
ncbi:MAG: GFA family protein [Pseudomonadota bacterium]